MAAFDRDASIERQQIHEISLNVARRLRQVLDRHHYISAAMRPEVDSTVRVITGIQRDIDHIMAALPSDEALDFGILTHIMGGQRHALDLLEILEQKLEGTQGGHQRDSARVHQALLTVSREIERDALRYAADGHPVPASRDFSTGRDTPAPRPPAGEQRPLPQRGAGKPSPAPGAPRPKKQPQRPRPRAPRVDIRALASKPVPVAIAALTVGAGLTIAILGLLPQDGGSAHQAASTFSGQTVGNRFAGTGDASTPSGSAENVAITVPAMEQPYLVVLTTRRSTEELQQDYRAFKANYPDLLGSAKARVDRVQGQDRQTWYRLSLIPPQTRDDAKTLCHDLRKAGLSGCWIKPVPLR